MPKKKAKPTKKKPARRYLYAATLATGEVAVFDTHPIVELTAEAAQERALAAFTIDELGKPVRYVLEASVRAGGR